jgi:hypothetical protein
MAIKITRSHLLSKNLHSYQRSQMFITVGHERHVQVFMTSSLLSRR